MAINIQSAKVAAVKFKAWPLPMISYSPMKTLELAIIAKTILDILTTSYHLSIYEKGPGLFVAANPWRDAPTLSQLYDTISFYDVRCHDRYYHTGIRMSRFL